MQTITSAKTSGNRLAAGFKKITWFTGTVNLDLGGGKYDKATEYLATLRVKNVIYDPYNRDYIFNTPGLGLIMTHQADTVTCFNVLNVIKEEEERAIVIHQAWMALKPGCVAHFSVYEGDKSGIGKETRNGWQENRKLITYYDEITSIFPFAVRFGRLYYCVKPLTIPVNCATMRSIEERKS